MAEFKMRHPNGFVVTVKSENRRDVLAKRGYKPAASGKKSSGGDGGEKAADGAGSTADGKKA